MKVELLILDVDGVLTDGTKIYDENHEVLGKRYMCKDFTAIKRFIASGVDVVMLSGDNFNRKMAEKRNIDFYCSRGKDLSLDKSKFLDQFEDVYKVNKNKMAFIGDDYFDLSMFESLKNTFATSDSPDIIKEKAFYVLKNRGGQGAVVELYDLFIKLGWVDEPSPKSVAELDKLETSSRDMS